MTESMPDPVEFAETWIDAWNRRDVDTVLTLYDDDVLFTSPTAQRVVPESGGIVRGKDALRGYWLRALEGNRDLRFTLLNIYVGIETVVLHYTNQHNALINEVMTFRDGLIVVGHATHLRTRE
jgi:ketosteroid isomerase-like protein